MQGDITRSTFRRENHYDSVRMQQGRVQLDADWNEQVEIQQYLDHTTHTDLIGPCGVPKDGGGFAVEVQGAALISTAGRIYVDGILCENEQQVALTDQPDLPDFTLPDDAGLYLAYLDVWERGITALDDPRIREVALGGPDTATRTRVVWQIKLLPVGDPDLETNCDTVFPAWDDLVGAQSGRLTGRAEPESGTPNPCVVPPGAGYRRLENQLYRVEIHRGGPVGTATFKWSRENGSIQTGWVGQSVNDLMVSAPGRDSVLGFATGQWVELADDSNELFDETLHPTGNPGTLVKLLRAEGQVLTIDPATATGSVTLTDFPRNPKIRRWDQPSTQPGEVVVEVPTANGGFLALEDGVEIRFEEGATYRAGDYWLIPARTITGDVEWPRDAANAPIPQPPNGNRHHYCRLALLNLNGTTWQVVEDCRPRFPTLTQICAEDVCFDNTNCQLVDVETVQDALERLCAESDLRFHNKHLHGWGIVCGLQATCGPDEEERRTNVTVHSGYAIDCEGNDIQLREDETLDIMKMIEILRRQNPDDPPLDDKGNGEVSMVLGLQERQHVITIEKYRPKGDDWKILLAGTMLLDIYNDCIKNIEDFLREQLTVPPQEEGRPAGPASQRVSALSNLLAQGVNPKTGQRLFLSRREHDILREFYNKLRDILQSETFCALFDDARPYPDYPEQLGQMDTIFAKGAHQRLRLRRGVRPTGLEGYSVGPGLNPLRPATTINRYDLEKGVLISQIDPIAGTETGGDKKPKAKTDSGAGSIQDVAFSPDGQRIYVIAPTRNEENTFFRVGDFDRRGNITWRPIVTICGTKLVTLATTRADPANVYAIGMTKVSTTSNGTTRTEVRGKGLYRINPENVDPNMEPVKLFNSVGHLVITDDGRAFASAALPNTEALTYRSIVGVQLPGLAPIFPPHGDGFPVEEGRDDIAVATRAVGGGNIEENIYVVTGPARGRKAIQVFDMNGRPSAPPVSVPDTTIRLQPYAPTNSLLMTWEDDYSVRLIDMQTHQLVRDYLLPMQVNPIAIAADQETQRMFALNYLSNTMTVANGAVLRPAFRFPLAALAAYRKQAVEAFADLTAAFLQYLKDCLCEHFLVNCPECTGDEKLYLGCVSIRANQVYKICNFTGRKTVGSFPTWGYWLSLVPIIPLLHRVIEEFCCLVLPDIFRYTAPDFDQEETFTAESRVRGSSFRSGFAFMQGADVGTLVRDLFNKGNMTSKLLGRALQQPEARATLAVPSIVTSDIVDQPTDEVLTRLKGHGVEVRRVPFEPANAPGLATNLGGLFRQPTPGSAVTLHEEDGKVVYYSVAPQDPATQELRGHITTLSDSLQARDSELQQLRTQVDAQRVALGEVETVKTTLASTQEKLNQREAELGTLRTQLQDLQRVQSDLIKQGSAERVQALETQLADFRKFRDDVQKFIKKQEPQ
ncbi:MAG TPA: DUF6519 domain-containing protein [Chloroflexia bacterium]|nr:DUF6519 domain-containing protein [Chloroflexia bacterium]